MKLWDFLGFVLIIIISILAFNFLPLKQQYWLYVSKIETLYKNVSGVEFAQKPSWLQNTLAHLHSQIQYLFENVKKINIY